MGDRRKQALRVQFDGKLKLEFHGAKITSDAGLLTFRELDEAFRLTEKGSLVLSDCRRGKNTQHTMLAMLRQGVYGRLAGYEDVNDAERLRVDSASSCRWPSERKEGRVRQRDGPLRDGDVEFEEEPDGADGSFRYLDRLRPGVCQNLLQRESDATCP